MLCRSGVSQNKGYLLGAPIIGTIVYWGLCWGPLILGNYQVCLQRMFFAQKLWNVANPSNILFAASGGRKV